ncbi:hypothetical protein D3C79_658420 [compost metagenome]
MGRLGGRLLGTDLRSNVAGELDHFVQAALGVEDRVVGSLEVNHLPQLVDPLEAVRMVFATIERGPEGLVACRLAFAFVAEQAVMLADNLFVTIMHGVEKVLVGLDHLALRGELDHRH